MRFATVVSLVALFGAACQQSYPLSPTGAALEGERSSSQSVGVVGSVTGDGTYDAGTLVDFSVNALQNGDGSAKGGFRHRATLASGLVDVSGRVTCVAIDASTGRAWVGGVVTENHSTSPNFLTPIHQVGRDVWFRVLDDGEGRDAVDRSSFLGFEGGAGIITSAEYCAARIWPNTPPNTRTSPVTAGNIQVRP